MKHIYCILTTFWWFLHSLSLWCSGVRVWATRGRRAYINRTTINYKQNQVVTSTWKSSLLLPMVCYIKKQITYTLQKILNTFTICTYKDMYAHTHNHTYVHCKHHIHHHVRVYYSQDCPVDVASSCLHACFRLVYHFLEENSMAEILHV